MLKFEERFNKSSASKSFYELLERLKEAERLHEQSVHEAKLKQKIAAEGKKEIPS